NTKLTEPTEIKDQFSSLWAPWSLCLNVLQHDVIHRRGKEQRIDSIEDSTVPWNQRGAVLDARAALQHRLEEIASDPERDHCRAQQRPHPERQRRQPPRARDGERRRAEQESAGGALDGLLRA